MQQSLAAWEVSLIRGMIEHLNLNNQEALAYFSIPERPINQGRISDIKSGIHEHSNVRIASSAQVRQFIQGYPKKSAWDYLNELDAKASEIGFSE